MIIRHQFFFLLFAFFVYGQEFNAEDLELVTDSSSAIASSQETISADSSPLPSSPIAGEGKTIVPYVELSFGNIWSRYIETVDFWKYTLRLEGYGISAGLFFQPREALRIEAGIRFHRSGNRINTHDEFYVVEYDSITYEPIDSAFTVFDGYFKQDQYYLSIPVNANVFLKGLPLYVLGGVELGYLLRASWYMEYSANERHHSERSPNETEFYRPLDFSFNVGSGVSMDLSKRFDLDLQLVFSAGAFMINNADYWGVKFMSREVSLRWLLNWKRTD